VVVSVVECHYKWLNYIHSCNATVLEVTQTLSFVGLGLVFMGVFTVCSVSSSRPVVEILCDL
jgi:hypothetical protein